MAYYDSEMTPWETHGTQLRMVTDELVGATDKLETNSGFMVIIAEDLLADIVAAQTRLQSIRE